MKIAELKPIFAKTFPGAENMVDGELYISMECRVSTHRCPCGCGEEVVLMFSKQDWKLQFDGTVSITPSVGNYGYPCKSHYFITNNKVVWC